MNLSFEVNKCLLICEENCSLKYVNGNGYKSNYFQENNAHISWLMFFRTTRKLNTIVNLLSIKTHFAHINLYDN